MDTLSLPCDGTISQRARPIIEVMLRRSTARLDSDCWPTRQRADGFVRPIRHPWATTRLRHLWLQGQVVDSRKVLADVFSDPWALHPGDNGQENDSWRRATISWWRRRQTRAILPVPPMMQRFLGGTAHEANARHAILARQRRRRRGSRQRADRPTSAADAFGGFLRELRTRAPFARGQEFCLA